MAGEGDIRLYPVVGWESATLPDAGVMLTMKYLPGEPSKPLTTAQMHALAEVHRFGMTVEQCDELARALQQIASKSRERRSAAKE